MNYPFQANNLSSDNSRNQFMLTQSSVSMGTSKMSLSNNNASNDMQTIFSYMKNVLSNPSMMQQMEKFMAQKQAQKNRNFIRNVNNQSLSISRMQPQLKTSNYQQIIQGPSQQKPAPLKMGNKDNYKKVNTTMNRKKGGDVLANYINNQSQQIRQSNQIDYNNYDQISIKRNTKLIQQQETSTVHSKSKAQQNKKIQTKSQKPAIAFDDMPIKSKFIQNIQNNASDHFSQNYAQYPYENTQNFNSIKNNKPNHAKKSSKDFYQKQIQSSFTTNQYRNVPNMKQNSKNKKDDYKFSKNNTNQYSQFQERPITGTKKDFKQLLKEKFQQLPFQKNLQANSNENIFLKNQVDKGDQQQYDQQKEIESNNKNIEQKPKKQFLKRGSRQYLSSAKDKKPDRKNEEKKFHDNSQQNMNTSRLGIGSNDRDKTPTKRDVSQNRILSKRNANNNQKSVSKLKNNDKMNQSYNESFNQQAEQNSKRSITPKNQKTYKNPVKPSPLPPKSNKSLINSNKDNIFTDKAASGKKKNVFDDSSSQDQNTQNHSQKQQQSKSANATKHNYKPEKQFNLLERQKKQEVIQGVYLTKTQLAAIIEKYAPKVVAKNVGGSEQKFNELRKKYTDLCNLLQTQKLEHQQKMSRQRQEFQIYKNQQIQKLKNEKRVMQRQLKSSMPSQSQNLQKDKEQMQNIKKQLQRQKEEHKKKQKNNKILIQKYKKQNDQMKMRLQKLEQELQNISSSRNSNNFASTSSDRQNHIINSVNSAKTGNNNQNRGNNATEKSRSKTNLNNDLSPLKSKKDPKNLKSNDENEQDNEAANDKNYKKTVPLYKGVNKQNPAKNNKTKFGSKSSFEQNNNSDDENLPSFKVQVNNEENNPNLISKNKTSANNHKKYQYVQNSIQNDHSSNQRKKQFSHKPKTGSKNVFAQSDEQSQNNSRQQQNQQSWQNENNGFFKPQPKYQKLSDLMSNHFSIKNVTSQMIQSLFKYQNNSEYRKYLQRINNPKRMIVNSSKNGVDKKLTNIYNDKSKQILFENGVKKQIFEDGYTIIYFKNGDLKQKLVDGTTLYYFKQKQVDQITLINGINIYRFQNNQVQLHFDGGKYIQIRHPDGTIKTLGSPVN